MDLKVKKLKNCKVELSIALSDEELSKYRQIALSEIWNVISVKWFRKWHIPPSVVEQNVWQEYIKWETVNQAINKSLVKASEKENLFVISKPEVKIESEIPLKFLAVFEVKPQIALWDYQKVKVKRSEVKVAKKEIDEQLEFFRLQVAENKKVDREVMNWDIAIVDFEWFDTKWKAMPNTKSDNFSLEIWSWKMIPWFEDEVIWMKTWEEKDFEITFPKEYHANEMAWKKFKFHIKVNEVQEKILPEVNEEFVKKITWTKKSVEDFRSEIETHLKSKKETEELRRLEDELLKEWSKSINFELPLSEVEKEAEWMVDSIKLQWLQNWIPWEMYQKKIWKTEVELKKEFSPNALENVKKRYIVQEIIKKEWISVDDKEIQLELSKYEIEALSRWQKFDKSKYKKWSKNYLTVLNQILIWKLFDKYIPKLQG